MFTYDDIISQDTCEINDNTILYIIKTDNFYIKGISEGLENLSSDPSTRADSYWLIDTKQLLGEASNSEDIKNIIFPKNHLTSQALPLDKIKACLGFDPEIKAPTKFTYRIARPRELPFFGHLPPFTNSLAGPVMLTWNQRHQPGNQPRLRELNFWQRKAIEALQTHGLTAEMLLNRNENGHTFDESHHYTLEKLVIRRNYTINQALESIDGLSSYQAGGIKEGLEREDVIGLTNFWHINALGKFKDVGLTAEMLLNRNENGHTFNDSHYYAFERLVIQRNYTINKALEAIDGLSSDQAGGIKEGLEREDVIGLTNFWHIKALAKLKAFGLTATMLLLRNEESHTFRKQHCSALEVLVKERAYTISDALEAIDEGSYDLTLRSSH